MNQTQPLTKSIAAAKPSMQEPNPVTNNISAAVKPTNPSRPSNHQIEPHKPSMMLMEIFGEVSRFDFESVGFDDEDNEISRFDEVGLGEAGLDEAEISCSQIHLSLSQESVAGDDRKNTQSPT